MNILLSTFFLYKWYYCLISQYSNYTIYAPSSQLHFIQLLAICLRIPFLEIMILNALLQNTMYQFLKLHLVNLTDNDQLCKGILRNGYRITLLICTKLMDTDAKSFCNLAHNTKLRFLNPCHNVKNCSLRHTGNSGKLRNCILRSSAVAILF